MMTPTSSSTPVHPRLRGEDSVPLVRSMMSCGSPPLARGRSLRLPVEHEHGRFTPACAGKMMVPAGALSSVQVHPRLRGEDYDRFKVTVPDYGSPPLARGRFWIITDLSNCNRFTPACAGKMGVGRGAGSLTTVHPRLRGEDSTSPGKSQSAGGSPPLARGRFGLGRPAGADRRFTPACAGKIRWRRRSSIRNPVHPRLRGEDIDKRLTPETIVGSPPLARGRCLNRHAKETRGRFTPACAGKIATIRSSPHCSPVHPRLRGEDWFHGTRSSRAHGSPPLARGRFDPVQQLLDPRRFTPACAGKIGPAAARSSARSVHPRLRGEDRTCLRTGKHASGSPPLARGRSQYVSIDTAGRRFTPACAGKICRARPAGPPAPVHPRLRGEDEHHPGAGYLFDGSPPLARGRYGLQGQDRLPDRFTPACAGKIVGSVVSSGARPVPPPRLRGEDFGRVGESDNLCGSPPLARGRSQQKPTLRAFYRFTPACAGKMGPYRPAIRCAPVHPRLRGEDGHGLRRRLDGLGSPPLARGRFLEFVVLQPGLRFTPACAGKMTPDGTLLMQQQVHPPLAQGRSRARSQGQ
ncbi:hypothetical protein D2E24_1913 [Bifidobacterium samirii]|uniref:Uncharacterized protein n=1 Tax=Bifidobacterium samirii TaxID=2306974 RepID=A0A430FDZ0_9BIFI|nr:hypothetical protein D2E24_1913 [Bifidobacterium samirii]